MPEIAPDGGEGAAHHSLSGPTGQRNRKRNRKRRARGARACRARAWGLRPAILALPPEHRPADLQQGSLGFLFSTGVGCRQTVPLTPA